MKVVHLILFILLLDLYYADGQLKQSDITKITFSALHGGGIFSAYNVTQLEISVDGSIRMYNDTYKPKPTIDDLIDSVGGTMSTENLRTTMSAEKFRNFHVDSSTRYYSGKMAKNELAILLNSIINMQADTNLLGSHCCCDNSLIYVVFVHLKTGKMQFMQCDDIKPGKTADLMRFFYALSYKPGYKQGAPFKFAIDGY